MSGQTWAIIGLIILVIVLIVALIIIVSQSKNYQVPENVQVYSTPTYHTLATPVVQPQAQAVVRQPVYTQQVSTPNVYYGVRGQDHAGDDIVYREDLVGNIQGLQQLCDATPECAGFNSGGYLKSATSPLFPSSYDFYYRQ